MAAVVFRPTNIKEPPLLERLRVEAGGAGDRRIGTGSPCAGVGGAERHPAPALLPMGQGSGLGANSCEFVRISLISDQKRPRKRPRRLVKCVWIRLDSS